MAQTGITLWANQDGQTLVGTAFDDVLGGLHGAATMVGGSGDDTYYVLSPLNTVVETAAGGSDTIVTWQSHQLGS